MSKSKRFSSLEAFYADDEARRRSGEADYGVWWSEPGVVGNWRVSYVRDTGEIYATLLRGRGQHGRVDILAVVPPDEGRRYYESPEALNELLSGWADRCGRPDSLSWVRAQLKQYRPEVRPRMG